MTPPVCYFIQSHRDPEQVARLVATIRAASPGAHLLVGHDARRCRLDRADLPPGDGIDVFHPPPPIERGRLSLLSPYWLALQRLAETGVDYDWLVYLTGQDYPTRPLAKLEAFLAASAYDGFLRWWPAFEAANPWGRRRQGVFRYRYRYRDLPPALAPWLRPLRFLNGLQSLVHLHLTYGPRLGVRARRTPFDGGRVCYAGTQWTTLRRECAEFLADAMRRETGLLAYYERTVCPDESVVQTLLVNSARFRLCNDDLRYADFRGSRDGSPRVLGEPDYDRLAAHPGYFARKFEARRDARILDRLDERIFGPGGQSAIRLAASTS